MKRVPHAIFLYLLCALLTLSSCGTQTAEEDASQATGTDYTTQETAATTSAAIDPTSLFSDRDLEGTYEESSAISIQLTSDSAVCDSSSCLHQRLTDHHHGRRRLPSLRYAY